MSHPGPARLAGSVSRRGIAGPDRSHPAAAGRGGPAGAGRRAANRLLAAALVAAVLALAGCAGGNGGKPAARSSRTPAAAPSTVSPATPTTPTTPTTPAATLPSGAAGVSCPEQAQHATQVRFPNGGGATLAGLLFGSGKTGIVLAHQSNGGVCQWVTYAMELTGRGYAVLVFDFTGFGASTGHKVDTPIEGDVVAAAGLLRQRGITRVLLIGASMGGTASLVAATQIKPPVAGVVSLSGPSQYHQTDAAPVAPKLAVPVLYAVGERDNLDFVESARTMYAHTPAGTPHQLVTAPTPSHGTALLLGTAPQVVAALDAFLARYAPRG